MYYITDTTQRNSVYSALASRTREFRQRLSFGEWQVSGTSRSFAADITYEKGIIKLDISQQGNSDGSGLVMGCCCSSSCAAEFYNLDKTYNYDGKIMFVECGVKFPVEITYEAIDGGYYLTSNGKLIEATTTYAKVTNLIPVFPNDKFVYTGRGEYGAASVLWYDSNKNFLSGEEYASGTDNHITTVTVEAPENAAYVRFQSFDYDPEIIFEVSKANDSFYYIPCGYYKVESPETDDDWRTVSLTAYDDIDRMGEKWTSSLTYPSTAYLVLKEITDKYGIELDFGSGISTILRNREITEAEALTLTSYTEREVCGFIAGLAGANARMNSIGSMRVAWYTEQPADYAVSIPANLQWQNGFKKTAESAFVINSVTSGIDDAVFTAGTGTGITFANPIITEAEITAIYEKYGGMRFQPCTCEWRGNPCLECGDIVTVTDRNSVEYTVYIANQDIDLTGGLSMSVTCPGGDADISFDTVDERTRAALNRQYTELQQAIIEATNAINGALGGYYEILDNDSDGNPDGWIIKETQDGSSGIIRANKAGIGLSTDGGVNYQTAITFSGINANCINTGKVKAKYIETENLIISQSNVEISEDVSLNDYFKTDNDFTYIDGGKIYTGSILADSIAANAVTTDKLSVGVGTKLNLFYNNEFYDGTTGWYAYNGTLTAQGTEQSWAYMQFKPTDSGLSAIMQKVWLTSGKRYSIIAQIYPLNWSENASTCYIRPFHGGAPVVAGNDLSTAYNYNGETVVKLVFDYSGDTGFVDLGIAFRGIMENSSTPCTINIAWMAFSDAANENIGFYCSRKEWLASGYKETNYLDGSVGNSTTADGYLTKPALDIDANGNLVTLGRIESNNGELGSMVYDRKRMEMLSHSWYKLSDTSNMLMTSRISLIAPLDVVDLTDENYTPEYTALNNVDAMGLISARIEVADVSSTGVGGMTMMTSAGLSVANYDENGTVTHYTSVQKNGVATDNFMVTSREASKKEISQKRSVLSAFKSSKIYEYNMKYDEDKTQKKTGFVIERETPSDVISDDGKHINLYSMAAMNWKATQEILERLELLEKAVKQNA